MAFGWSSTRHSPIAVDFGVDSIKMLQVIQGEPPQIIAAASMDVPPEARTDPAVRMPFLFEALHKMVRSQPFKGRRAILSIPAYQTLIQHMQIARQEGEDLNSQIAINLRQRLNVDPSRMVVRHFPVTEVIREGSSKQEIICVAASRDAVMNHIEMAQRAKLDVVGMHCEPLAIIKAFGHLSLNNQENQSSTHCFIDLGAATTKVVIALQGQMVFAKTIHIGGDHFTNQLARAKQISFAEAKQLRIDELASKSQASASVMEAQPAMAAAPIGAAGSLAMIQARMAAERQSQQAESHQPDTQARPSGQAASSLVQPAGDTLECLIDELQLCIRHHQSIFPQNQVDKLVFLGGESRQVNICQKIARQLRIGAQLGDPLARAVRLTQRGKASGVDLQRAQPGWAVAMGLCLSQPNI